MARPVEFLAKVYRKKLRSNLTPEEEEERNIQRIISGNIEEEDEEEPVYRRVILDLERLVDPLELDPGFVQVVSPMAQLVYVLKVDYDVFKALYQSVTQINILSIDSVNK